MLTYRKIGGLHFVRIGALQLSFCRVRSHVTLAARLRAWAARRRAARVALAAERDARRAFAAQMERNARFLARTMRAAGDEADARVLDNTAALWRDYGRA